MCRCGRGAYGETIVFGLVKRHGEVYRQGRRQKNHLQAITLGRVGLGSSIYSDGFAGHDVLVDVGYDKHYRINHSSDDFSRGNNHINGNEGFWEIAQTCLAKFRGMSKNTFYLRLKECEFRYNRRGQGLYWQILKVIVENPLL